MKTICRSKGLKLVKVELTFTDVERIMDALNARSLRYSELELHDAVKVYEQLWCQFYETINC